MDHIYYGNLVINVENLKLSIIQVVGVNEENSLHLSVILKNAEHS